MIASPWFAITTITTTTTTCWLAWVPASSSCGSSCPEAAGSFDFMCHRIKIRHLLGLNANPTLFFRASTDWPGDDLLYVA